MFDKNRAYETTWFRLAFVNSASVVDKSWIICRRISRFLQISLRDSYAAGVKKEWLFLSRKNRCKKQLFNSFAAKYAKRPRIEGEQSSWPKHIKIVHLVFWESFNVWYKKYSDRFLLKKRDDRSLALLDIFKIFIARNGDIFTFEKHIYLIFSYQTSIILFS